MLFVERVKSREMIIIMRIIKIGSKEKLQSICYVNDEKVRKEKREWIVSLVRKSLHGLTNCGNE